MIKKSEVEKLAELSRIEITEEEKETLAKEMESILSYISEIKAISSDISDSDEIPLVNVMREDEKPHVRGLYTEALLKAMPKNRKGYLKVKKILKQE